MTLLDRHISFVEALRRAGLPVSLSEDLDSVRAITDLGLHDRDALRAGLAATLVKREQHRSSFDAIFDLFYPVMLGSGSLDLEADAATAAAALGGDNDELLRRLRERITEAMHADDREAMDARRHSAFAIGAIGDERSRSLLERFTSNSDPYLAEIAREALLQIAKVTDES